MQLFLYSKWISLPINVRIKIANQFNIQKRSSTEVVDNQIKSDGYKINEVEEALNIDALQEYIGTQETDMMMLWMWLVDKIEGRELTQVNIDTTITNMDVDNKVMAINPMMTVKPKRGRSKKYA